MESALLNFKQFWTMVLAPCRRSVVDTLTRLPKSSTTRSGGLLISSPTTRISAVADPSRHPRRAKRFSMQLFIMLIHMHTRSKPTICVRNTKPFEDRYLSRKVVEESHKETMQFSSSFKKWEEIGNNKIESFWKCSGAAPGTSDEGCWYMFLVLWIGKHEVFCIHSTIHRDTLLYRMSLLPCWTRAQIIPWARLVTKNGSHTDNLVEWTLQIRIGRIVSWHQTSGASVQILGTFVIDFIFSARTCTSTTKISRTNFNKS